MRILSLDMSSKCGWAVLEGEPGTTPKLVKYGCLASNRKIAEFGNYPFSYLNAAQFQAENIVGKLLKYPEDKDLASYDGIVIEETNMGRARYTQKYLEYLHACVLTLLKQFPAIPVYYVNTSDWRKQVGAVLSKDDKKLNAKVRTLKKANDKAGLKKLGVRGKVGKKHVAVRYVNENYSLGFKLKDNDMADAVCMGVAFFLGVKKCDGV